MTDESKALLTAFVDFAKALVWPSLIAGTLLLFRDEVTALLRRMARVKIGDNELVFQGSSERSEKIAEADERIKSIELRPGPDGFLSAVTIREIVDASGLIQARDKSSAELLLFHTTAQKTWLVSTKTHIFILLDDSGTRKDNRLIQTILDKSRILPIQTQVSEGAPIVRFGAEDIWWFYSDHLFSRPRVLEKALRRLVGL